MPVFAQQIASIDAAEDRIAELVRSAVARLGWRVSNVNSALNEFHAECEKRERIKGIHWQHTYRATITWEPISPENTEVLVDVRQEQGNSTKQECDEICRQFMQIVFERAQTMKRLNASRPAPKTFGSQRWSTVDDILKANYWRPEPDSEQFLLGPFNGGVISVPKAQTQAHALVCGPTGAGKTASVFIPNLVERLDTSAIVTEATAGKEPPDLFLKTSGFRKASGPQQVYYFNPDDLRSNQINPLDMVNSVDSAQVIAGLIIDNTRKKNSGGDPIWETSERHLLTAMIMHVVGEKGDIAMIRRLMREGPAELHRTFRGSKIAEARDEYVAFYKNSSEGFRNGVVSGLLVRLYLWTNPRVAKLTNSTDIDFEKLRQQLFTFYLSTPGHRPEYRPLSALIFSFLLNLALTEKFDHPISLVLDEFTNYGTIPAFADKLTLIRHIKVPALLGIQDYVQLQRTYGMDEAKLIWSQPDTKVFFRPRELETAKRISEMLGKTTLSDRKVTSAGQIMEREFGRFLMEPGEVMAMDPQKAIVMTSQTPPILLERYKWQDYAHHAQFKPPELRSLQVDETLTRTCAEQRKEPGWEKQYKSSEDYKEHQRSRSAKRKPLREPEGLRDSDNVRQPEEVQESNVADDEFSEPAP